MISVSDAWKEYAKDSSRYGIRISVSLNNGTTMTLGHSDLMLDGVSWQEDITDVGDFKLGCVVTNSFNVKLNNIDGRFDNVDFTDACLVPYVAVGDEEKQRGKFYIRGHKNSGSIIDLVSYDKLYDLDESVYADGRSHASFSIGDTYASIVSNILSDYEIELDQSNISDGSITFQNCTDTIQLDSDGTDCTARDCLGYIFEMSGNFAKMTNEGKFKIFSVATSNPTDITKIIDPPSVDFKPYKVTGVLVAYTTDSAFSYSNDTLEYTDGKNDYASVGTDGGIYYISNNPYIKAEWLAEYVAQRIYDSIGGIEIYPFSASIQADPTKEVGDAVTIDSKTSIITSYSLCIGKSSAISFDADQYGETTFAEVWKKIRR